MLVVTLCTFAYTITASSHCRWTFSQVIKDGAFLFRLVVVVDRDRNRLDIVNFKKTNKAKRNTHRAVTFNLLRRKNRFSYIRTRWTSDNNIISNNHYKDSPSLNAD